MENHVFCFNIVGLSPLLLKKLIKMPGFSRLMEKGKTADVVPVFPCLTLPCQASISTGTFPVDHGIVSNGFYYRDRFEVSFWDQYRSLVQAEPVWETMKKRDVNLKTALLFCQSTLHGGADIIITPKPMHTDKGLVQWCYSKPVGLYEKICQDMGRDFNLMDYWGPFASSKASEWIMEAAIHIAKTQMPNFMVTYIPHLDYSCQKFGPHDPKIDDDLKVVDQLMTNFIHSLEKTGIWENSTICVFSEYSLSNVTGAVLLNLELRRAGFLKVREIETREYLDFEMSRAFAMVDHQVAHIYVKNRRDIEPVNNFVAGIPGVNKVLSKDLKALLKIDHERSGELVAISDPDKWFAYYWWENSEIAPDFAFNIDIHRKPGYDPLELFMDKKTFKIPQTPELIKGSHGAPARDGQGLSVFMVSGQGVDNLDLPHTLDMIQIAPVLKKMVTHQDA
jgi:predicted AlkP superfamily pyrophosphatase or phosphodiesterase